MKTWIKSTLALGTALLVVAPSAQAQLTYCTEYSYTGIFGAPSCGGSVFAMFGTANLRFTGQASTGPLGLPSNIDMGSVTVMSGSGVATGLIYMRINQFGPTVGSAIMIGSLSGAISMTSSVGEINWNTPPTRFATIGDINYQLERRSLGFTPINPGASGLQTIRGQAVMLVPEPSTYLLLASGLGALGIATRRRKS